PAVCVVGVLEVNDPTDLHHALAGSNLWNSVKDSCNGFPKFIGKCAFGSNHRNPLPETLEIDDTDQDTQFSLVFYRPHDPASLRFYTLDAPENAVPLHAIPASHPWAALASLDFTRLSPVGIENAINEINSASLVQSIVYAPAKPPRLLPTTASFLLTLAYNLTILSNIVLYFSRLFTKFANLPIIPIFSLDIFGTRPANASKGTEYMRLQDISATVQYLDVRTEQAIFFITQVTTLQRQDTRNVGTYSYKYTNFFNTVWLILNDMTIGMAIGTFLIENKHVLSIIINRYVQMPRETLFWLDAWPAGLKLNTQLSGFYVNMFVGIIDTWNAIMPPLSPILFEYLGHLSCFGGLTLLLAISSDLLSLVLTAHLRLMYEIARGIYWAAGVRLGGGLLWGVFRGKRRNVLRQRTDTWSYDIDQLLFGTVLFTLIAFLFPTALVYYMLFAALRLGTLLLQAGVETLLAFMHHFPLFALMLRAKDPKRLPGGIFLSLQRPRLRTGVQQDSNTKVTSVYLSLESQPISFPAIFFQYIELWNRLLKHYNPLRLLYLVLAGKHLGSIPLYSIRYESEHDVQRRRALDEAGKEKVE
ncbi:hypothetical protein CVT24_005368, partial [Panaeolus cyanescens]